MSLLPTRDESPDKNGEDEDDNSDDEDEDDREGMEDAEFPSLSSVGSGGSGGSGGGLLSPRCNGEGDGEGYGGSPSLTTSMNMVDQVLSNEAMDRLEKIDRLEAILAAATQGSGTSSPAAPSSISPPAPCCCPCHGAAPSSSPHVVPHHPHGGASPQSYASRADAGCQTLSTGDIVITKVFFPDSPDNTKEKK